MSRNRWPWVLALLVALPVSAAEIEGRWDTQFADYSLDGSPRLLSTWNGWLVAANGFERGGAVLLEDEIGAWDGQRWRPLPGFFGGVPDSLRAAQPFTAMGRLEGDLVVAGRYYEEPTGVPRVSVCRVAIRNGESWRQLGTDFPGEVKDLVIHRGELVASGFFPDPVDERRRVLLRWTGAAWEEIPGPRSESISSIASHQDDLVVYGRTFELDSILHRTERLETWDGDQWSELPRPGDRRIRALASYRGELVAAVAAYGAGEQLVSRWDGTGWRGLGEGIVYEPRSDDDDGSQSVDLLMVDGGDLLAAGQFTVAGGRVSHHVAAWNGVDWRSFGADLAGSPRALTRWNGQLVVGGSVFLEGAVPGDDLVLWTGTGWAEPRPASGVGSTVIGFFPHGSALLVLGNIREAAGARTPTGVRWTGDAFAPLELPLEVAYLRAAVEYQGDLYAAGNFYVDRQADPPRFSPLARFDGSSWEFLDAAPDTWAVQSLCVFDSKLYIGGGDHRFGDGLLVVLQSFDGERFEPVPMHPGAEIRAMAVHQGRLVVAGYLREAGGAPANMIAAFDGTHWDAMAGGVGGTVEALLVHDDDLIVGGYFNVTGDLTPARSIARWDGSAWHAMGDGLHYDCCPEPGAVTALALHQGRVHAAGHFDRSGSEIVRRLARWDGRAWLPVHDAPMPGPLFALASWDGDLWVGGRFHAIGGTNSQNIARWIPTPGYVPSTGIALRSIAPNPLNPATTIRYALSHRDHVRVDVYDARGRHVARLVDAVREPGPHQVQWSGRTDDGRTVASGVYYVRITGADGSDRGKMTLIK